MSPASTNYQTLFSHTYFLYEGVNIEDVPSVNLHLDKILNFASVYDHRRLAQLARSGLDYLAAKNWKRSEKNCCRIMREYFVIKRKAVSLFMETS